jgi:hypothetical protein
MPTPLIELVELIKEAWKPGMEEAWRQFYKENPPHWERVFDDPPQIGDEPPP